MANADNNLILCEREGHCARITINRPEVRNALSLPTLLRLREVLAEIAADSGIWTVLVTGAGDKSFCAGADLKERRGMDESQVREFVANISGAMNDLANLPQPTLAYINGHALGGGCELALACDLRVMHEDALIGLPETGLAIIPGAGGCVRLPRLVGSARAKELILLARRIDANQALEHGLINFVGGAELAAEVLDELGLKGPLALRAAKAAIDGGQGLSTEAALALEASCYQTIVKTSDRVEALNAFMEKRAPRFSGK
jgi:enoyl-CoA hydratase/carnithine racemase